MDDLNDGKKSKDESGSHQSVLETFRVAIFDTIPNPLLVLDTDLVVLTANDGFYKHFKVTPEKTVGRDVFDIGNKQWDIPGRKTLLKNITRKVTS